MQPPVPENRPVGDIPGPESNHLPVPGLPPELDVRGSDGPPRRPGRIREQDENTAARPETVAEARARQRAQRQRAEDEQREAAEAEAAAQKRARRRKQMIGAGVGVGVVGAIALLYVAIPDRDEVPTQTAYCTTGDGQVVSDNYCSTGTINPVTGFILLNGLSYRYNYGGNVVGGRVTGGSYDRPTGTAFRTSSGSAVDPGKATSFGSNGQSNAAAKPAAPKAGSSRSGKNIDRGGLGSPNKGGSGGSGRSSGS